MIQTCSSVCYFRIYTHDYAVAISFALLVPLKRTQILIKMKFLTASLLLAALSLVSIQVDGAYTIICSFGSDHRVTPTVDFF